MDLGELARHWTAFGEQDPLFAVLSDVRTRDGKWDVERFFETGRADIDAALGRVAELGATPDRAAALDFGCGVGRLSRALAVHYASVVGVDIAPTMVEGANRLNADEPRCCFVVNDRDDLSMFDDGSFDFVYSVIVLQHMEPRYSMAYIAEFVRVLRPGGVAVFQIPVGPVAPQEVRRLPDTAYVADLRLTGAPRTLAAGERAVVGVRVRNDGTDTWPAWSSDTPPVTVGNHWSSSRGTVLVRDDGRVGLPHDLGPGESVEVQLPVRAPAAGGRLTLEVDVVHESVAWFADHGSTPAREPVQVTGPSSRHWPWRRSTPATGAAAPEAEPFTPVMETYGVPEAEVRATVESGGARVLATDVDWATGATWHSRTFYLQR